MRSNFVSQLKSIRFLFFHMDIRAETPERKKSDQSITFSVDRPIGSFLSLLFLFLFLCLVHRSGCYRGRASESDFTWRPKSPATDLDIQHEYKFNTSGGHRGSLLCQVEQAYSAALFPSNTGDDLIFFFSSFFLFFLV